MYIRLTTTECISVEGLDLLACGTQQLHERFYSYTLLPEEVHVAVCELKCGF